MPKDDESGGLVEVRVGSGCDALALSRQIYYHMSKSNNVRLLMIGAGAVSQAVKAVSRARDRGLKEGTFDMVMRPSMSTTQDTVRPGASDPTPLSRVELEISRESL